MPRGRTRTAETIEYRALLTATMCLLAAGAVMVYSASSARALLAGEGDGSVYLIRYVGFGMLGIVALVAFARMPLTMVRSLTPALLLVAFGLLLAVLVPGIGIEVNGARRWIGAGAFSFQPSEVMKLALVLYAVRILTDDPRRARSLHAVWKPLLVVAGAAFLLIAAQPDLGTALVLAFTIGAILVVAGLPLRQLGLLAAGGAMFVLVYSLSSAYRRERLTSFLDPWGDASDSGFQVVQAHIGIGSGGLMGNGIGESVQKVYYLPEPHTDFILAIVGDETGLIGILALLVLYGVLANAGMKAAREARSAYAKLLAAGLTALILCQAPLNIFTVLGLAPLTGVPLPFVSYGVTNLVVLLACVGLLLNVASGRPTHLRVVRGGRGGSRAGADRRRRDSRPRRSGAGRGRRAAG